jgi:hypothetical protein
MVSVSLPDKAESIVRRGQGANNRSCAQTICAKKAHDSRRGAWRHSAIGYREGAVAAIGGGGFCGSPGGA